jgi:pyocin large subunit-like protein
MKADFQIKTVEKKGAGHKHWRDHRAEFPNLQNAKQYVEAAWDFVTNPPVGVLSKTRANGDVLLYDATSNIFAVKNAQGVPRTMFKPTDGAAYFHRLK